jgi:hypothetical protein
MFSALLPSGVKRSIETSAADLRVYVIVAEDDEGFG